MSPISVKTAKELFYYESNRHRSRQTLEALQGYGLPELDYFLEHFLPAFGLTLDELQ